MNDFKVLHMVGKGGGRGKQQMFIDYLISQGVDVKVVDNAGSSRGMSFDYVIVDEWVKENKVSIFKDKLNKAKDVYEGMALLVKICQKSNSDVWGIYWESFWDLSREFPFKVEWYDPDGSYQEDIMSRYLAIEGFMENINNVMKERDCE